jgi:hypothetical protein
MRSLLAQLADIFSVCETGLSLHVLLNISGWQRMGR